MTSKPDLSSSIGLTLLTLQLLEEAIREYLDDTMRLIKKNIKKPPLNFSLYNKKDTLGTLVKSFAKVSGNQTLVKSLKKISEKRNELAHKIWLDWRDEIEKWRNLEQNDLALKVAFYNTTKSREVQEIRNEAQQCLMGIFGETVMLE